MAKGPQRATKQEYIDRFWSRVDKRGACWRWTKRLTEWGYGSFYAVIDGITYWKAHRFSWVIHNGPIPDRLHVLHKCDNPWCVNPDHLEVGTQAKNIRQRDKHGRGPQGERHGAAKLTEADVRAIRASSDSATELGKRYNIDGSHILRIQRREKWAHVD